MFTRLLFLVALLISLAAGPGVPGSTWASLGVNMERCDCCVATVEPTCCSIPTTPTQRVPISSTTANHEQLKLVPQPVVALLPARLAVKQPAPELPAKVEEQAPGSPLIDRICIRLI